MLEIIIVYPITIIGILIGIWGIIQSINIWNGKDTISFVEWISKKENK